MCGSYSSVSLMVLQRQIPRYQMLKHNIISNGLEFDGFEFLKSGYIQLCFFTNISYSSLGLYN